MFLDDLRLDDIDIHCRCIPYSTCTSESSWEAFHWQRRPKNEAAGIIVDKAQKRTSILQLGQKRRFLLLQQRRLHGKMSCRIPRIVHRSSTKFLQDGQPVRIRIRFMIAEIGVISGNKQTNN